ncbi:HEAT repeat domain-containing protein [Prochlorococcus marinus]|uniref:HEAT repeat domain-containing protein n=1 Tax=Prochlorococcus marinus TaxID=1219 RepID=UPI0022B53C94|nr:HEAT repeat domain-containing protein [Prochlorococcus marinus]
MNEDNPPSLNSLFADLNHPNPNINYKASLKMIRFWPEEASIKLINNLDSQNVEIRRKSVKALALFGPDIVNQILNLYMSKEDKIFQVSCLKVLVRIASMYSLNNFKSEINFLLEKALKDDSAEVILTVVSLLKQIGNQSIPVLKMLCRDRNVLRAKAAITALIEIPDPANKDFLQSIANDFSLDKFIRESATEAINM